MHRPTMEDVAARAGVSRALVSLVMRDSPKVSPGRRAAVLAAATELGYQPHAIARQLASRSSTVLAVLVSDLLNPFFAEIAEQLETLALPEGLQTILGSGGRRPAGERRSVQTLLSFRPAGLVLLGPGVPASVLERASLVTPVVLVARATRLARVDTVNEDERAGSALAVEHLVGLGHRRIVHLEGGDGSQAALRRKGFADAVQRHGLRAWVEASEYTEDAGEASARRVLAGGRPFTAVVAANDVNAIGAISALEGAGLRVPQDVSVVGYDNTSLAALRHVGLTTVDQPSAELARLALESLLQRLRDGRTEPVRHLLHPRLVVRTTTAQSPP
jgi:DNA-binding LacI/PurR family transcriptional regulator